MHGRATIAGISCVLSALIDVYTYKSDSRISFESTSWGGAKLLGQVTKKKIRPLAPGGAAPLALSKTDMRGLVPQYGKIWSGLKRLASTGGKKRLLHQLLNERAGHVWTYPHVTMHQRAFVQHRLGTVQGGNVGALEESPDGDLITPEQPSSRRDCKQGRPRAYSPADGTTGKYYRDYM